MGLPFVNQQLVEDAENRKALHARFLVSQQKSQDDPWQQRAEGVEEHQFEIITQT
jgi:nitrite reductase (NADH) large subunit